MATPEDILVLRRMIADTEEPYDFTDEELSSYLDNEELYGLAARLWREKAGKVASLVDVSESGSSRKLGDMHEQALSMAAHFDGLVGSDDPTAGRPTTRRIVRPEPTV